VLLFTGDLDQPVFEDWCRQQLGSNSYELFTLMALVDKLTKQLQACATDDVVAQCAP
jgi:hypothetical protein